MRAQNCELFSPLLRKLYSRNKKGVSLIISRRNAFFAYPFLDRLFHRRGYPWWSYGSTTSAPRKNTQLRGEWKIPFTRGLVMLAEA